MKKIIFALFLFLFFCLSLNADNYLYYRLNAILLVQNPYEAADKLADWVTSQGGYILYKSKDKVVLRFPYYQAIDFKRFIELTADEIISISLDASYQRVRITELQSGITSREEILALNMDFIEQTNVDGTLTMEKEIMRLMEEIESLKGQLRKLNTDCQMGYAEIFLNYKQETLPGYIPSSFDWINRIDFYSFINEGF